MSLLFLLLACSSAPAPATRVFIVGMDGASWRVMEPMMAAGQLPNLAAMRSGGTTGVLMSEGPLLSPSVWNTIFTGQSRDKHGITDFKRADDHIFTAADRRVPALWTVAAHHQLSTGFAGFWNTWPAEEGHEGWMVSDRFARSRWTEWGDGTAAQAAVWPEELEQTLAGAHLDPAGEPEQALLELADWSADERRMLMEADTPLQYHGPTVLKYGWASQRTYENATFSLLAAKGAPAVGGLMLIATDPASHTFWHHYEPSAFEPDAGAAPERLGGVIPAVYAHDDAVIGKLRQALGPDTVILVVSDHGFRASGASPKQVSNRIKARAIAGEKGFVTVGSTGGHEREGVLLASGGPVVAGQTLRASIYDIMPTTLALLGLPVPEDLPGRVLTELAEPAFWEAHPVKTVPTNEGVVPLPSFPEDLVAPGEDALDAQLKALGYVDEAPRRRPRDGKVKARRPRRPPPTRPTPPEGG